MQATTEQAEPKRRVWTLVYEVPGGHRYFEDRATNQVSACDDSGARPERTDDGILWIDKSRPVLIKGDRAAFACVPVIVARDGNREAHVIERPENAIGIAVRFGLELDVSGSFARAFTVLLSALSNGARVRINGAS